MATPYYPSDYDQPHRFSGRPRDFDSHPLRSYLDHEQEPLSLSSAFRDLDLNGARDRRPPSPPSPAGSRSIHASPASPHTRRARNVSDPGDASVSALRPRTGPRESIDSPRLQNLSPTNRVSPTMSRDVGLYRHGPRTPAVNELSTHGLPSPGYGRYAGDRWRTSSASPASRVPHHFSREHHFYRSEDPLIDMQTRQSTYSYDRPVLCNCRTCVAHRYPMRNWPLSDYDDFGAQQSASPVYQREAYPIARSTRPSPRMPYVPSTRDDWVYPGEDYRLDHYPDPHYDQYGYRPEEYTYPNLARREMYGDFNSLWLGHGYGDSNYYRDDDNDSDDSYNGVGSGHEYSDGASYTGYRHYDGHSDGEYSGGDYDSD